MLPSILYRKRGETLVLELTCTDRYDNRQSLAGATNVGLNIYSQDLQPVITGDSANLERLETADPETFGDVKYTRPDDGTLQLGEYKVDIVGTFGAAGPAKFPEKGYLTLIIN